MATTVEDLSSKLKPFTHEESEAERKRLGLPPLPEGFILDRGSTATEPTASKQFLSEEESRVEAQRLGIPPPPPGFVLKVSREGELPTAVKVPRETIAPQQEPTPPNAINQALGSILGLPVDAVTSALNALGANIQQPFGGSESIAGILQAPVASAEVAATIGSGAIAEPVAGVAGTAAALTPFLEPGVGARVVESVREGLTFEPRTEEGQEALESVAKVFAPVGEAFIGAGEALGDSAFERTGSPALAAAATTIPTAIAEAIGIGVVGGTIKAVKGIKRRRGEREISREIKQAVPAVEQLKDTSRAVFKEIDDLGVSVKSDSYNKLVQKLERIAMQGGADSIITPKAIQSLGRFEELIGTNVTLTNLDTLRTVAQNAAKSLEPPDASLGVQFINEVDEFLDKAKPPDFSGSKNAVKDIGKRYKTARNLWGRARRSELLEESFFKARLQATGFENGIRTQFRSILNNKRQRKLFNKQEIKEIRRVVEGDKKVNLAKLVGRLGFSEGGATNVLGSLAGVAVGGTVGGVPGAIVVPLIGQISRKLAQRLTRQNAEFADQVIRAGKDARKITKAYLDNTPKAFRDPAELSELLMRPDINLSDVPAEGVALRATRLAQQRRVEGLGADVAGSIAPENGNVNGS